MQFIDSPILTLDFKYNLNDVKDIKVSKDFLERNDKGCSIEGFDNCTTRTYVSKVMEKCGCLPFSMKFGYQESNVNLSSFGFVYILTHTSL